MSILVGDATTGRARRFPASIYSAALESVAGRGKLRTYLGIAPGVGKTYAMLRDGRAERRVGVDAVVAYWERTVGQRLLLSSAISSCFPPAR